MRGKRWAAAALLALATTTSVPLAVAANAAVVHPKPGTVFAGAPRGFGSDRMHWLVSSNGKTMKLQGSFAWSYGCSRPLHNYGIADAATLRQSSHGAIPLFRAPTLAIRASSFSGSTELQKNGHKYGRFTIHGNFTSDRSAKASFSFAKPPHCGTLSFRFVLRSS
jgi:hypothetical protein